MKQISLYRDLQWNLRSSEDSRIVLSSWGTPVDGHASESPAISAENAKAITNYYALSAERLLYRVKVLCLSADDGFAASEALQRARPFGQDGPDFALLYDPSVSIAMAFIPLTPEGGNGKPVLARLYCVKGLVSSYPPPFADGANLSALARYSWFVAGLPDKLADEPVNGRSWLLAANLLMNVVGKNATASTKKNLATSFIVSGDVVNGNIRPVEMGRKPELATIKEYRNLKWIIPMKNTNDMTNIPPHLVEKPATLEEAYELIESMQNRATKSFFRFLKAADIEGMKEQYANGADLFAEDESTGKAPLQLITESIAEVESLPKANEKGECDFKRQKRLDKLVPARDWLKGQGADCTMMIYILAKSRMLNVLDSCLKRFPINARDERGLTAVDWAIISGDWETARLLYSMGGTCDQTAKYNMLINKAINEDREVLESSTELCWLSNDRIELLRKALEVGLDPDACDLFGIAVKYGLDKLAESCLKAGRDPSKKLTYGGFGESQTPVLAIAEDFAALLDNEKQNLLLEMLFQYGVERTPGLEQMIAHAKGRSFVHKACKRLVSYKNYLDQILSSLDNKSLLFSDKFKICSYVEEVSEYSYDVSGSLFALALAKGWTEIVAKCLDTGASPTKEIRTTYMEWNGSSIEGWYECTYECASPIAFVNSEKRDYHTFSEKKRELTALLRSYMPPDELTGDIPF